MTDAADVSVEHEGSLKEEEDEATGPESSGSLETVVQQDSDPDIATSYREPLIDRNGCEDELEGCVQFIDKFTRLYGDGVPDFFAGTLETAAAEAFAGRRLLALYLHNVRSPGVHVFCATVLSAQRVKEAFRDHCLLWGWDLSRDGGRRRFLESCGSALGRASGQTVDIPEERLPAVVLVSRVRATTEIRRVVGCTATAEELFAEVRATAGEISLLLETVAREERARHSRERLLALQDSDYRESLEIDRAKDVEKRRRLEERQQEDCRERAVLEERKLEAEAEKRRIEAELGEEPASGVALKFRPPGGAGTFQRNFVPSSSLQEVVNFAAVRGYGPRDFRLVAGWPRADLSGLSLDLTLEEIGLAKPETVIIQHRSD